MKLLIVMFFSIISIAVNAKAYQRYCFDSNDQAGAAFSKLVYFKTTHDMFELDEKCVDIYTIERRVEFFQQFVKTKFPLVKLALSNTSSPVKKNCKLEVEQILKGKKNKKKISAAQRLYFGEEDSNTDSTSVSALTLQPGSPGTIAVDKEVITLTCNPSGNGYDIVISVGSTNSKLQSTVFLGKGQSVEIGSVIRQLNDKGHSINAPNSVSLNKTTTSRIKQIFLKHRQ